MRTFRFFFALLLASALLSAIQATAAPVPGQEARRQNKSFEKWWDTKLNWRFDDLPTDAIVPNFRLPYSGSIYPDQSKGTAHVLRKYDRAFNHGSRVAEAFEYRDIESTKERKRGGLFGFRMVNKTPYWAGHCNGWTASAIRHAEPSKSVSRNGVVFSPSDIKGLLAELYTYTAIEELGGDNGTVNPGILHVTLANWLGRYQHPIAMDSTTGKEVWNYPIYAYRSSSAKRSNRRVEVKLNIGYANYTEQEFDKGPQDYKFMYFHYMLDLDSRGNIVGGHYFRDSNRIDMLWVPLKPTRGGREGNERGNPYLDDKMVLSLWRASVSKELRAKWFAIDASPADQVTWETAKKAADSEKPSETNSTGPAESKEEATTEDEVELRIPEVMID